MVEALDFIQADDWCAIYVGGSKIYEGHSIPSFIWLQLLEEGPFGTRNLYASQDWVESYGFPQFFGEIPMEVLEVMA